MAKRDRGHDRIKVTIEWTQPDESIVGKLAHEAILGRIATSLPSKQEMGLQSDIRKDITLTRLESGALRHKHVYRFKYKRPYRNTRQCDLWYIWRFAIKQKTFEEELAGELNFKVDVDAQADRLPWVFDNGDRSSSIPLKLAMRPGCQVYTVAGLNEVKVPRSSDSLIELLGFKPDEDRYGTDFMIIGEPRAAWKLYKYYQQLQRGGKLNQADLDNHRLSTAFPDLVCVLYRHNRIHRDWALVNSDGPKMYGQYQEHLLTGLPMTGARYNCPDFGMRYEIMDVNPK